MMVKYKKKNHFFLNTIEIQFQMPLNLDHSSLARHGADLFSSYPDTEQINSHVIPTRSWSILILPRVVGAGRGA